MSMMEVAWVFISGMATLILIAVYFDMKGDE